MIEELKPDYINRVPYAPEPLEMLEKINEIIHQVNTLAIDMHYVMLNLKNGSEGKEETGGEVAKTNGGRK